MVNVVEKQGKQTAVSAALGSAGASWHAVTCGNLAPRTILEHSRKQRTGSDFFLRCLPRTANSTISASLRGVYRVYDCSISGEAARAICRFCHLRPELVSDGPTSAVIFKTRVSLANTSIVVTPTMIYPATNPSGIITSVERVPSTIQCCTRYGDLSGDFVPEAKFLNLNTLQYAWTARRSGIERLCVTRLHSNVKLTSYRKLKLSATTCLWDMQG